MGQSSAQGGIDAVISFRLVQWQLRSSSHNGITQRQKYDPRTGDRSHDPLQTGSLPSTCRSPDFIFSRTDFSQLKEK
jgi:hypothetical protein